MKMNNYRINWNRVGKTVAPLVLITGLVVGAVKLGSSNTKSLLVSDSYADILSTDAPAQVEVYIPEPTAEPVYEPVSSVTSAFEVQGQTQKKYYVKANEAVNVRSNCDSSTKDSVLTTLRTGESLEALSQYPMDNGWYQVIYNGDIAYIKADYVSVYERVIEEEVPVIIATTGVKVRSDSNTNSEKLGVLTRGEVLSYVQTMPNGWHQVIYNGRVAYVSGDYSTVTTEGLHYETVPVVTTTSELNIRREPSQDSELVYTVEKGTVLQYTSKTANGWYEVLLDGYPAYVSGKYVKTGTKEIVTNKVYGIVSTKSDTVLYGTKNFSDPIASVPQFSIGKIYNIGDNYCLVKTDYGTGYLRRSDTENLGETTIVVDVTSQLQSLIEGGEYIFTSKVVTGHSKNSPTPSGIWSVYEKYEHTTMAGHNVYYAMRLARNGKKTNYFLHDADEWRNGKYGGDIYINHGSNGCVNNGRNNAKRFYDATPVNTKVLIYRSPRR